MSGAQPNEFDERARDALVRCRRTVLELAETCSRNHRGLPAEEAAAAALAGKIRAVKLQYQDLARDLSRSTRQIVKQRRWRRWKRWGRTVLRVLLNLFWGNDDDD